MNAAWPGIIAHMRECMMGDEPAGSIFTSDFRLGQRVCIDGDGSIVGIVIGMAWESNGAQSIKVGWMHAGTSQEGWFSADRLAGWVRL